MTEKKTETKKPIWETESEEEIAEGREEFNQRIKRNFATATMLKERVEEFKPKPNTVPALTTMRKYFILANLVKLDHGETLELFKIVFEGFIELEKKLATKLQYLEDNMQVIGEKTDTELLKMKNDVALVKQNAIAFKNILKEEQTQEDEEKWRKIAEGKDDYVV